MKANFTNFFFTTEKVPSTDLGLHAPKGKGSLNETGQVQKGQTAVKALFDRGGGTYSNSAQAMSSTIEIAAPKGACYIHLTSINWATNDFLGLPQSETWIENEMKATDIDIYLLCKYSKDTQYTAKGTTPVWRGETILNSSSATPSKENITVHLPTAYPSLGIDQATRGWGLGKLINLANMCKSINNAYVQWWKGSGRFMHDTDIAYMQETYNGMSEEDIELANLLDVTWVSYQFYSGIASSNDSNRFNKVLASKVYTNFPIFEAIQVHQICEYFRTGDTTGSINEPYLELEDVDLSTDYTIYVDGNYPNLTVLAKSAKLEEWLNSIDNKNGLVKSDFKVIYYKDILATTELGSVVYGQPFLTSYNEVLNEITGESDLYMRLMYDNKIKSAIVYAHIDKVGISTNPAFNESKWTWGLSRFNEFVDNSTVTFKFEPYKEDDYEEPTPPEDDIDDTDIDDTVTTDTVLTRTYKMTESQLAQFGAWIWGDTFETSIFKVNSSPIENIVGLKKSPVPVSGALEEIKVGNLLSGVNGERINQIYVQDVGEITVNELYGNFLDYAPFTQLTLFLPFIGFVEIDTNLVMGKRLKIKYSFDWNTGQCRAYMYVNGTYVMYFDGQGMMDIALTSSNKAIVDSNILASQVGALMSGSANPADYMLAYAGKQYSSTSQGNYSAMCAWIETRQVYLHYNRPTVQYPSNFGHVKGYPCNLTLTLRSCTGLTICEDGIDLSSIPCTEQEKEEIRTLLTTGVYL